jgi:hypothetical protein
MSCWLEYTKLGAEVVGFALSAGTLTAAVAVEMLPEVGALLLSATSLYECLKAENDPDAEEVHKRVEGFEQEYDLLKLALEAAG